MSIEMLYCINNMYCITIILDSSIRPVSVSERPRHSPPGKRSSCLNSEVQGYAFPDLGHARAWGNPTDAKLRVVWIDFCGGGGSSPLSRRDSVIRVGGEGFQIALSDLQSHTASDREPETQDVLPQGEDHITIFRDRIRKQVFPIQHTL